MSTIEQERKDSRDLDQMIVVVAIAIGVLMALIALTWLANRQAESPSPDLPSYAATKSQVEHLSTFDRDFVQQTAATVKHWPYPLGNPNELMARQQVVLGTWKAVCATPQIADGLDAAQTVMDEPGLRLMYPGDEEWTVTDRQHNAELMLSRC